MPEATPAAKPKPDAKAAPAIRTITIELPILPPNPASYAIGHVEVRLNLQQKEAFGRVLGALNGTHCRLKDCRHVESNADAVRFIAERIFDAAAAAEE